MFDTTQYVIWLSVIGALLVLSVIQAIVLRERGNTIRNLRNALTKEYREHDREMRRIEARHSLVMIGGGGAGGSAGTPDPRLNKHSTLPEFYGQPEPSENPDQLGWLNEPEPPASEAERAAINQRLEQIGMELDAIDPPSAPMSAPPVPVQAIGDKYEHHEIGWNNREGFFDRMVGGSRNST